MRICGRALRRVHTDPNIFLIDDFLTEAEIQHLDGLVTPARFAKSYTDADDGKKVVDDYRTSTFVHLGKSCDAHIRQIESRAATIVGMAPDYVEPLQVVQYSEGQKFETHHDMGTLGPDNTVEQVIPPRRLITFFIYLNSLPDDAGGHTEFPMLNLKVRPVRGQALLFCNVRRNGEPDERVIHRACPVEGRHVKVGMNLWIVDQSMAGLACVPARTSAWGGKRGGAKKTKDAPNKEAAQKGSAQGQDKANGSKPLGLLARLAASDAKGDASRAPRQHSPRAHGAPPPATDSTGGEERAGRGMRGGAFDTSGKREGAAGAGESQAESSTRKPKRRRDASLYFEETSPRQAGYLSETDEVQGVAGGGKRLKKSNSGGGGKSGCNGSGTSGSDAGGGSKDAGSAGRKRMLPRGADQEKLAAGRCEAGRQQHLSLRQGLRNSMATSRGGRRLTPCNLNLVPGLGAGRGRGRGRRGQRGRGAKAVGARGRQTIEAADGQAGGLGCAPVTLTRKKRKRLFTKVVCVCVFVLACVCVCVCARAHVC